VDPLLAQAVDVALGRGHASAVLLTRRLGVGFARAKSLIDQMVEQGVLGDMTASGTRPVIVSREDWEAR
jgi:S-DNA-T family DNA segregation ATPase FtsK/SpoIIIE